MLAVRTPKDALQTIQLITAASLATTLSTARPLVLSEISIWISAPGILIASILVTYGLSYVIDVAMENSTSFRKHVFGKNYIEGFWWAKVLVENTDRIEVTCIEYKDGGFQIQGWQYTDDSSALSVTWNSQVVKFDGSKLIYFYHATFHERLGAPNVFGISELTFVRKDVASAPTAFSGYYEDFHTPGEFQHTFQAVRLSDEQASIFPTSPFVVIKQFVKSEKTGGDGAKQA
jgi:hypothetical protein